MDENINYEELLKQRDESVDRILKNFKFWNGGIDEVIELFKENQQEMERIDILNLQLSRYPKAQNEEYILKIEEIIEEQKRFQAFIKETRDALLKNMQQLNKKDKVIKNYISKKKNPVFIDKDVK